MVYFHKTPIDETLYVWLKNYPESFHPLDLMRFYTFVKTKIRYSRCTKWDNLSFFAKKVREINPNLDSQIIERYFIMMRDFTEYDRARYLGSMTLSSDPNDDYLQVRVINGNKIVEKLDKSKL